MLFFGASRHARKALRDECQMTNSLKKSAPLIFALALALFAGAANALEFKAVGQNAAVLYDAPSEKGQRVFIAPRNMPVEVVLTYGDWTKIRDASGDLSWIASKALSPRRYVIVTSLNAKIRARADDASPVVFSADRHVLLELVEPVASGWVHVRHQDGQSGFLRPAEVWGD